ncbi:MAG: hypothetical protein WBV79_11810 [Rhodomicrobium sp.]
MRVCLEGRLGKICPTKIGAAEIDAIDHGVSKIDVAEIGPSKIAPSKINAPQTGSLEITFSKAGSAEIYRQPSVSSPPRVPDIYATDEDAKEVRLTIASLTKFELYGHFRLLCGAWEAHTIVFRIPNYLNCFPSAMASKGFGG